MWCLARQLQATLRRLQSLYPDHSAWIFSATILSVSKSVFDHKCSISAISPGSSGLCRLCCVVLDLRSKPRPKKSPQSSPSPYSPSNFSYKAHAHLHTCQVGMPPGTRLTPTQVGQVSSVPCRRCGIMVWGQAVHTLSRGSLPQVGHGEAKSKGTSSVLGPPAGTPAGTRLTPTQVGQVSSVPCRTWGIIVWGQVVHILSRGSLPQVGHGDTKSEGTLFVSGTSDPSLLAIVWALSMNCEGSGVGTKWG